MTGVGGDDGKGLFWNLLPEILLRPTVRETHAVWLHLPSDSRGRVCPFDLAFNHAILLDRMTRSLVYFWSNYKIISFDI